jgi:hypothetical protein
MRPSLRPAATVIVRLDILHEKRNKVYFEARQDLLIHSPTVLDVEPLKTTWSAHS